MSCQNQADLKPSINYYTVFPLVKIKSKTFFFIIVELQTKPSKNSKFSHVSSIAEKGTAITIVKVHAISVLVQLHTRSTRNSKKKIYDLKGLTNIDNFQRGSGFHSILMSIGQIMYHGIVLIISRYYVMMWICLVARCRLVFIGYPKVSTDSQEPVRRSINKHSSVAKVYSRYQVHILVYICLFMCSCLFIIAPLIKHMFCISCRFVHAPVFLAFDFYSFVQYPRWYLNCFSLRLCHEVS